MKKEPLRPYLQSGRIEAGCDEAGRGCLAGPVFAAAVILPEGFYHPDLNDSKKLTLIKRNSLRILIEKMAVSWSVASISPGKIDEINILNASIQAMHLAVTGLIKKNATPDFLLIDGHRFKPYPGIPHSCEIKGDGRFLSIAAASVLAKTHRDACMEKLHMDFPQYAWNQNKGYPTPKHRQGIAAHGVTIHHRKSFRLLNDQLDINFKYPE